MTTTKNLRWCKTKCGCGNDGGSAGTYQKRVYALAVAVAMHGAPVCHCGRSVSLWDGEVDRTAAGCYRPGFVVMTCHGCNNDRTNVEEFDAIAFQRDVLAASIGIEILSLAECKRIWQAGRVVGETLKTSKYLKK